MIDDFYHNLNSLDEKFLHFLFTRNCKTHEALLLYRNTRVIDDEILIDAARLLERFVLILFDIDSCAFISDAQLISECKRHFIQRNKTQCTSSDIQTQIEKVLKTSFSEIQFARSVTTWMTDPAQYAYELDVAAQFADWKLKNNTDNLSLFDIPKKLDYSSLIEVRRTQHGHLISKYKTSRDGFDLTDHGATDIESEVQSRYCIFCHKRKKDSCSRGIYNQDGSIKESPLKIPLHGCPLDEKISEMNLLKSRGYNIAALAIAMIDNPMCAGTGHRICNDCMKSCIYQKQTPVNIPKIETNILKCVLNLPYGFEIYNLLSLWNPLKSEEYLPAKHNNIKVLVVGLGPAGYTLSHYLTHLGYDVTAIDGLKIEPLQSNISGTDEFGNKCEFDLIKNISTIWEKLSERTIYGFGGVAEYGITARWDKNFLKVIRIILERRKNFHMRGSTRFGSNVTYDDAIRLGFKHIALCIGAGKPNIINIPNIMARGVRLASDFLMSLQLTGAYKKNSIANLQIRLPIVVMGAGLTAVDIATESMAYYEIQVKNFRERFLDLNMEFDDIFTTQEEKNISSEYLRHGEMLENGDKLSNSATIIYRKTLQDSPSYRLNHEELEMGMREGVQFLENAKPIEVLVDDFQHVSGIRVKINDEIRDIPAKCILVAIGTQSNLIEEYSDFLETSGRYFKLYDSDEIGLNKCFIIHRSKEISISCFGDAHPIYNGSVVKAMASAKTGYKVISKLLSSQNAI